MLWRYHNFKTSNDFSSISLKHIFNHGLSFRHFVQKVSGNNKRIRIICCHKSIFFFLLLLLCEHKLFTDMTWGQNNGKKKKKKDPLLTLEHAKRLHEIKNSIQRFFKLLLTNRLTFLDGVGIANILVSVADNLDDGNLSIQPRQWEPQEIS